MGTAFNENIDKVIKAIELDPSRYNELIGKMDEAIEVVGSDNEFPINLTDALKKEVKGRIDDAVGLLKE